MAKKIYINPGHSNIDPGAVGYEVERKLAVKVADYMVSYLKKTYVCETKKTPGTMGSLTAISKQANEWDADLFVSIHFNAGGGNGYEALVYSKAAEPLGRVFEKHIKAIGQNSRGVKFRPDLGVLKLTNMKAILNEGAFVDNWKDIKAWNDNAELKKMGEAYAKAAAEYLKLPKIAPKPYTVKVSISNLNIRTGPGTKYSRVGFIAPGVYTIVKTDGKWGKLKSGDGWICLDYAKKV